MSHTLRGQAPSDAELVAMAVSPRTDRDRAEAFDAIAWRHHRAVLDQCAYWLRDPDAAQDVGQTTFAEAFSLLGKGKPPAEPSRLRGWLIKIAQNRKKEYLRKKRATPQGWARAALPEYQGFDDLPDYEEREENRSGRALRLARAQRLVNLVVSSLGETDQQIYQLRFQQELSDREIGQRLGIKPSTAGNRATLLKREIAERFGVLILALEGGPHCAGLARILQEAQFRGGEEDFTAKLREQIVKHFSTCPKCGNCRTCAANRRTLVAPYAPVLILLLFSAEFMERIIEIIGQMTGQNPPTHTAPPGSPPAELTAWTEPGRPQRDRAAGHRRARRNRWPVTLAVAAGAAAVVIAAVTGIALAGKSHPAAGSPGAVPTPPQAVLGAVVPARSCGRGQAGATGTVRLPAGLTLPPGAAVFDTSVTGRPGSPAARYMIGPASQSCTRISPGGGSSIQIVGAQDGPERVFTLLTPGAVDPSCSTTSGNGAAQQMAIIAGAQPCRATEAKLVKGAVTTSLLHDDPGVSAVAAWVPSTKYASDLFAPVIGNLPTYGVLGAQTAVGHTPAYDAEEISCTLPPSQASICSAALRYFLIQAAGPGTPTAALRAALNTLQRFISQRNSAR